MLDHAAYPGIVGRVIDLAPFESLLVLRTASHTLRSRVDAHLAHHLLCDWYDVRSVVRGLAVRHPAFYGLCPQSIYPLILLPIRPTTARLWVCGTPTTLDVGVALAPDAPSLIVIGRPFARPGPLPVMAEPPVALTTRTRRVVYHLSKGASSPALFRAIEARAPVLRDFEVILIVGDLNRRTGFLLWEMTHLARDNPHLKVTVVDPPKEWRVRYPGPVSSQEMAESCGNFEEWARAVVGSEEFEEQWRFHGLEEYRRTLPPAQFALEMGHML